MNIHTAKWTLHEILAANEALLEARRKELMQMPAGELRMRPGRKEGQVYYYHIVDGKKRSLIDDMEMARLLAQKKFLAASLPEIEKNIKGLKRLLNGYADVSAGEIMEKLPLGYSKLLDEQETKWIEARRAWMAEDFVQSKYKPWRKVHMTARGLAVRSKSEVIIADRQDYYGIPYRYEQVLQIGKYDFVPDFTILTKRGVVWWEHCGKVNDPEYMRKHNWKLHIYESAGIVPWKNLIVTYDDEEGNLDSRIIEAEIVNKILPYC